MIYAIFVMVLIGAAFYGIRFTIDKIVTKHNLKISQMEWNEFSKDMSYDEKCGNYFKFHQENKNKHGWKSYYFSMFPFPSFDNLVATTIRCDNIVVDDIYLDINGDDLI